MVQITHFRHGDPRLSRCVVRMVMSGFGTGAAWDAEIDGLTEGMRLALAALRVYLSHIHRQE